MAEISNQLIDIRDILKDKLNPKDRKGWDIKRYSDKDDFKSLWEINNGKKIGDKSIVVIWDGLPDNNNKYPNLVPIHKFITPIDWALAYSVKHKNNKPEKDKVITIRETM